MWRQLHEDSLGEVVTRVVDDGKDYVRAEIALAKAAVAAKVTAIRPIAIMLVAALFLLQAALTVLIAAFGMALATWLGVAGGLAVAAVIVLAILGAIVGIALKRLGKVFS